MVLRSPLLSLQPHQLSNTKYQLSNTSRKEFALIPSSVLFYVFSDSIVNRMAILLREYAVCVGYGHMDQFLQDGNFGRFMSILLKSRRLLLPNQ